MKFADAICSVLWTTEDQRQGRRVSPRQAPSFWQAAQKDAKAS